MEIPLELIKYVSVSNVRITLQGNELFIESSQGSIVIKLTDKQLKDLKIDFVHLNGG